MKKNLSISISLLLAFSHSYAIDTPAIHPNIIEENGNLVFVDGKTKSPLKSANAKYIPEQLVGNPKGTASGIKFDFGKIKGTLYYGFIKPGDGHYPLVVYKGSATIKSGEASLEILGNLGGKFDIVNWAETGQGTFGYRVVTQNGTILYDGKLAFIGKGPFSVNSASIIEGPFVNFSEAGNFHNSLRVSFDTLTDTMATVEVRNMEDDTQVHTFENDIPANHHEITLTDLQPDTAYSYQVKTQSGDHIYTESYSFQTAPPTEQKGSVPFYPFNYFL
jgi:hypothetical protein